MRRRYAVSGVAVLLLVLGGGYVLYVRAGDNAYDSAREAHRRGNCVRAVHLYDRVVGFYGLSYRSFEDLEGNRRECRELLRLDALVTADQFERALRGYVTFRNKHQASIVEQPALDHRQAVAYAAWGDSRLRRPGTRPVLLVLAAQSYDAALENDAGFAPAQNGFAAIRRRISSANVCLQALSVDALGAAKFVTPAGADFGDAALRQAPDLLVRCGRGLLSYGLPADAAWLLHRSLQSYRESPRASALRALWIEAEVAAAKPRFRDRLGQPLREGSAPAGKAQVVIASEARHPVHIFMSGPRPTELVFARGEPGACGLRSRFRTLTLEPGRYHVAVEATDKKGIVDTGTWSLAPGVRYDACVQSVRVLAGTAT
jgi:hypothetical protein